MILNAAWAGHAGGLTTKIHATVNEHGMPLEFYLSEGQAHDAPPAKILLAKLEPGQYALMDKAYDADWIRELIWEKGAIAVIPSKSSRKMPKEFDAEIYKKRNQVERFFGRKVNIHPQSGWFWFYP